MWRAAPRWRGRRETMAERKKERREERRVVALVCGGHFFSHFYLLGLAPLFPIIKAELGISYVELGGIITAFSIASGAAQYPMGVLVDRFGPRYILAGGLALLAGSFAAMGLAAGYWPLLALAFCAGLGNSVFHPADYSILGAAVSPRAARPGLFDPHLLRPNRLGGGAPGDGLHDGVVELARRAFPRRFGRAGHGPDPAGERAPVARRARPAARAAGAGGGPAGRRLAGPSVGAADPDDVRLLHDDGGGDGRHAGLHPGRPDDAVRHLAARRQPRN